MAPKVALGIYTGATVPDYMPLNVMGMCWELAQRDMWYFDTRLWMSSCRVDSNRNYLIHDFLHKTTADFLFIIDADMRHPGIAPVVLAERNLPVVCGLYFRRGQDQVYNPHFYRHTGESADERRGHGTDVNWYFATMTTEVTNALAQFPSVPYLDEPTVLANADGTPTDKGLMRIDGSGFGCVMLRRDALETIEKAGGPFLRDEPGLNGDFSFYKRCKQLGIEVWGDASVICSHGIQEFVGLKAFHDYVGRAQALHERMNPEPMLAAPGHEPNKVGYW